MQRKAGREAACAGKVQIPDAPHAVKAAKRRHGRHLYHCKFCGHWHTGTPNNMTDRAYKIRKQELRMKE